MAPRSTGNDVLHLGNENTRDEVGHSHIQGDHANVSVAWMLSMQGRGELAMLQDKVSCKLLALLLIKA